MWNKKFQPVTSQSEPMWVACKERFMIVTEKNKIYNYTVFIGEYVFELPAICASVFTDLC